MATAANKRPLAKLSGALVLVGAGKMGGALLDGWLECGLNPRKLTIVEPEPAKSIRSLVRRGVRLNPNKLTGPVAAIVIAVKPQLAADVVPQLTPLLGRHTTVISIMAGRTLAFLEQALPGAAIVRAMPNTPAAIGRGIAVLVGNNRIGTAGRRLAYALLAAVGAVEWVDDERLMNAVTAVSGSGPAYVFLLAEALARAGVAAGLPADLAETLARQTVAGSGELLDRSKLPAATLRQNVTSPGGTTAAALEVLMAAEGLEPLFIRAVAAATRRGKELAG